MKNNPISKIEFRCDLAVPLGNLLNYDQQGR
jgi:hypothetical protein